MKLVVSIWASGALVKMLINNHYPDKRPQMLRYFRSKMARLRYNIDQFLKTYKEKDTCGD